MFFARDLCARCAKPARHGIHVHCLRAVRAHTRSPRLGVESHAVSAAAWTGHGSTPATSGAGSAHAASSFTPGDGPAPVSSPRSLP